MPRITLTDAQKAALVEAVALEIVDHPNMTVPEIIVAAILATNAELAAILKPRLAQLRTSLQTSLANVETTATQHTESLTADLAGVDSLDALL